MSEQKKSTGDDPFDGLDWDAELESWDKSAEAPGGTSVPESFSKPPPSGIPPTQRLDPEPAKGTSKQARPLYRPPPTQARPSAATPPPRPAAPKPPVRADVIVPADPPKPSSDRPLPSLMDDDEPDARTRAGDAVPRLIDDDEEEEGVTVVAPVSQDLLDQLEAAGVKRGKKEPQQRPAAAPAVEISMEESVEERTEEHPAPEPEEPSVVTSAPDFLRARPLSRSTTDLQPKSVDAPLRPDGTFDPFAGMDLEPPVSESMARRESPAEGPKLLEPAARRHSPDEVTAVLDKKQLQLGVPRPPQTDADATTPEPLAAIRANEPDDDPFATADPFASADAVIEAREEPEGAALIDLLRGEDASSDGLPAVSGPELSVEKPAAEWVEGEVDVWRARCERVANDARTLDKNAKTRGLIVASELAAIAGDGALALELAEEAWQTTPNDPLAMRQLRQLFAAEGRWDDVAPILESEAKTGSNAVAKAHAALVAAEAARLTRASPDEAQKLYETAQRLSNNDLRPVLSRALSAIASGKPTPLLKWPQGIGAEPVAEAVVRRAKNGEPVEDVQIATVLEGLATFSEGGGVEPALSAALDELASSVSLGPAARWLRVALDAANAKTRPQALAKLADAAPGRANDEARLMLALDIGDVEAADAAATALAQSSPELATILAQQATRSLRGQPASAEALRPIGNEPGVPTVGRAMAIAANEDAPAVFARDDVLDASARVAQRLATGGWVDPELRGRTSRAAQLGFLLGDALGSGSPRATLEALSSILTWGTDAADESLARMFASLAEGDFDAAVEDARQAATVDPTSFPAIHALLGFGTEDAEAAAIIAAEGTTAEARGAALAVRVALAALRRGDLDMAKRAIDVALTAAPNQAVVPFLAELRARRAGDFDGVIEAVRARAHAANDPVARAQNLVREVFLLLGSDLATCIEKAQEANAAVPRDLTVRALYERIAGEGAQGRAEWRAELAATLTGEAKAETLLDAAREAERRGDLDAAEKYAFEAEAAGSGAEAVALRHRVQARGDGAARLAEELLEIAKRAPDADSQRELYETLADLDLFARGDATSAILWHQAILEGTPDHLPSLRRLEHMLVSEGREDDYEMVASQLARELPPDSRDAHAEVAARLRLRRPGTPWDSIADLIAAATERDNPSLWATRNLDALARLRGDDASFLRAVDLLLARVDRPAEVAALATRGAEAAFRSGDIERARGYLERALDADPQHPTALASFAELRRHTGDWRGAAETIEAMAQTQLVPEHRLEDWHAAAVIWLDKVGDAVRGRAALERAAEIDLAYGDVFDRLVAIARAGNETEVMADLYQRRLAQIEAPEERAQLQVAYARVLVEIGDRDAARAALAAALETVPTHEEALGEALRLAEEAQDWEEYEQHLIRMSRAQQDPQAQIAVLRKLGALYEGPLPNPSRAEAVYRKILEHDENDDDTRKRLVDVYVQLGDADMAVETHQERVRLTADPRERRARLIELARLLDEVASDPDRALRALEQARSADPSDLDALAALAEFHTRHGRPDAVAAALDHAIEDLHRRIARDPGDVALHHQLLKILELRGKHDAVRVVRAAIAGLAGEPSDLIGAEDAAGMSELDDLLCPEELRGAFRAFLEKAGEAIEKSVPVDLRALKAAKLGTTNPTLKAKIDAVARGFGLPDPDVVISRAMPLLCLPVSAKPFQIVIGEGLVSTDDEVARRFSLARTMKLCGARCASLVRVPPADLRTYLDALLHHLNPDHPAPEMDPERLDEITKRLQRFVPRKDEAELRSLAKTLGPVDVERLAGAAAVWGDRVALLAVGDLAAALRGVAWTLGQKDVPRDPELLREWLRQNPAARDLVVFAIGDEYIEARRRSGVG